MLEVAGNIMPCQMRTTFAYFLAFANVLRWHGFTLSSFNLPEQGVPVRPELDILQNVNAQPDAIQDTLNREQFYAAETIIEAAHEASLLRNAGLPVNRGKTVLH